MGIPSFKKSTVLTLAASLDLEELKNNRLILLTPYGMISGIPVLDWDKEPSDEYCNDLSYAVLPALLRRAMEAYNEDYSEAGAPLDGTDGCLLLKDVKISMPQPNNEATFKSLFVYYNQIIGATIGNIEM
ncbi:MAG TPA: hypothetical protein DIT32_03585 [Peptococcaceae bacterium]|nr:hypothetical protein [Peptococcaceae bacterium]